MSPSIAYGKSQKWYEEHCCVCDKKFTSTENRVRGIAIFKDDVAVKILAHESCSKTAQMQEAIKQTKELGKKDAGSKPSD